MEGKGAMPEVPGIAASSSERLRNERGFEG
jgi:hypothetical protein